MAWILLALLIVVLAGGGYLYWKKVQAEEKLRADLWVLQREEKALFDFLNQFGQRMTSGTDTGPAMDLIVSFAQEATTADAAGLFVRDKGGRTLRARVVSGLFPPFHEVTSDRLFSKRKYVAEMVKREVIEVGEGVIGRVAVTGRPLLVADASKDERIPKPDISGLAVKDLLAVPLNVRDENLGVLVLVNKREGPPFNEADESLITAVARQASVTLDLIRLHRDKQERQRLEQELELARTFQALLLPRRTPSYPNIRLAGAYRPALEIGGDYYDFIPIDDRYLGIAVGDVAGKGVPGALIMAAVRAALRAEARLSLSPREVLQRVNTVAREDTKDSVFITMTYGVLDTETGRFRFCRAGHEPVICCPGDGKGIVSYLPEGIALGIVEGETFGITEEQEIDLSSERTAILYTDGIVEAMNARSEEYGEMRFHRQVQQHASGSPEELLEAILGDVGKFVRDRDQHDDITIVVINWTGEAKSQQAPQTDETGVSTTA